MNESIFDNEAAKAAEVREDCEEWAACLEAVHVRAETVTPLLETILHSRPARQAVREGEKELPMCWE